MLNKIMMSGRLLTEPAVTTKDDLRYCKFSIAVEQPKQKGIEAIDTDTFTCLVFDDNANAVSFLYTKGGIISFVGSLRKAPDKSVVIIVEELHFQNKFAVKVDTNSGQIF